MIYDDVCMRVVQNEIAYQLFLIYVKKAKVSRHTQYWKEVFTKGSDFLCK